MAVQFQLHSAFGSFSCVAGCSGQPRALPGGLALAVHAPQGRGRPGHGPRHRVRTALGAWGSTPIPSCVSLVLPRLRVLDLLLKTCEHVVNTSRKRGKARSEGTRKVCEIKIRRALVCACAEHPVSDDDMSCCGLIAVLFIAAGRLQTRCFRESSAAHSGHTLTEPTGA